MSISSFITINYELEKETLDGECKLYSILEPIRIGNNRFIITNKEVIFIDQNFFRVLLKTKDINNVKKIEKEISKFYPKEIRNILLFNHLTN